jgi:hypothetical protein
MSDKCGALLNCGSCTLPEVCGSAVANVCGVSGNCTNLCLQQTSCTPTSTVTVLTGKVYAPNGVDPLPNVLVFVPNGTPQAFTQGVTCDQCSASSSAAQGSPLVSATTDINGTFTLRNVPTTDVTPTQPVPLPVPLVMQAGRWRRQVSLTSVPKCQTTTVATSLTRLPRNQSEGDIPRIAFSTGAVDALECIFRKIGVADTEFTDPTGSGRIHFFKGGASAGAKISSATPWETDLLGEHWDTVASMSQARTEHTANLLNDGTVFVAGGASGDGSGSLASTESYNPTANTWTTKASMTSNRTNAASTLLSDGTVLVTGGFTYPSTYLSTAERYNPTANSWVSTPGMGLPTPTPSCDGSIVISQVYGGSGSGGRFGTSTYDSDFIEIHNRGTTSVSLSGWSVQSASAGSSSWTVTSLSGNIGAGKYYLVKGGTYGGDHSLPAADATGSFGMSRGDGKVALLNTATALNSLCPTGGGIKDFIGWGYPGCSEGDAAPSHDRSTSDMRGASGCTDTQDNASDFSEQNVSPRNGSTGATICAVSVCAAGSTVGRALHTATLLNNGNVLVAAGWNGTTATSTSLLYNPSPSPGTWAFTNGMSTARYAHTATLLADGTVLVVGGITSGTTATNAVEVYSLTTGSWTTKTAIPTARAYHTATLLANGTVLVAGGISGSTYLTTSHIYNPATNAWTAGPSMSKAHVNHQAGLNPDNTVVVTGGRTGSSSYTKNTQVYNAIAGTFSIKDPGLDAARAYHTMTQLQTGKFLVTGGYNGSSVLSSVERSTSALLNNYDMVLFPCQGTDYAWSSEGVVKKSDPITSDGLHAVLEQNLATYAGVGGRVFSTHYNYSWLIDNGANPYSSPLSASANWTPNNGSYSDQKGYIDQSFAKGLQLAQWLKTPAIGASTVQGEIDIKTLRQDFTTVVTPTSQNWLSIGATTKKQMHFTFNTPIGAATASQCGRVVYSDFHVFDADTSGKTFPNECTTGTMTDQEKLLEFMIFDLGACIQPDHEGVGTCTPLTCQAQGLNCGQAGDGCGNTISCGTCTAPATCGGGGDQGICGTARTFSDGYFVRDYDASSVCASGFGPIWRLWSWSSTTPGNAHIDFTMQTASSTAGLDSAPKDQLLFSNPPGPAAAMSSTWAVGTCGPAASACVEGGAVAHTFGLPTAGMVDTTIGSASPDSTFLRNVRARNQNYVRVTIHLAPSSDLTKAPTLTWWDMQVDCVPNQ